MNLIKSKTIIHSFFPNAISLYSFLVTQCKVPKKNLVRNASKQFLSLLNDSIIFIPENEYKFIPKFSSLLPSPAFSFIEIFNRAINLIFQKSKFNVISLGYKKRHNSNTGNHVAGNNEIISIFPNTNANFFLSKNWQELYKKIGEEIMTFILVYSFLFIHLNNGCYIQILGVPMYNSKYLFKNVRHDNIENGNIKRKINFNNNETKIIKKSKIEETNEIDEDHNHIDSKTISNNSLSLRKFLFPVSDFLFSRLSYIPIKKYNYGYPFKHWINNEQNAKNSAMYTIFLNYTNKYFLDKKYNAKKLKRLKLFYPFFKRIIEKNKTINYRLLLTIYCPTVLDQKGKNNDKNNLIQDNYYIQHYTLYNQVYSFVWAILKLLIDKEFFGSHHNEMVFKQSLKKFIRMKKHGYLSLHDIVQHFRITDCQWLSLNNNNNNSPKNKNNCNKKNKYSLTEFEKQKEILHILLSFIFKELVIPLIKVNFYVTETIPYKYKLFYYRQDIWKAINIPVYQKFASTIFKEINDNRFYDLINNDEITFSYVRFVPKKSGMRAIINMSRKSVKCKHVDNLNIKLRVNSQYSINTILQNLYKILQFEINEKHHNFINNALFGDDDIFIKFKGYSMLLKQRYNSIPKLYFGKIDVQNAFDSIKQDNIIEILSHLMSEDEYLIQKYFLYYIIDNRKNRKFVNRVYTNDKFPQILDYTMEESKNHKNALFVDQVTYKYIRRDDLLNLLCWHIKENVVKMNNNYYKQVNGIPQGSVLSTIACSVFYSHLENNVLSFLKSDKDGLLMHYVDDFIYISPNKENVIKFVNSMRFNKKTCDEYGVSVNIEKSLINFEDYNNIYNLKDVPVNKDENFPWCGHIINTKSLNIKPDITKYNEESIKNSILTESVHNSGITFLKRLSLYIKGRFQPLYFDTILNTKDTVIYNVYEKFRNCALRFYFYQRKLEFHNENFLKNCIYKLIKSGYTRIKYKLKISFKDNNIHYECTLHKQTIKWLGLKAFFDVLTKKPTNFKNIISSLKKELLNPQYIKNIYYIKKYIQNSNKDDDIIKILNY